MRIPVFLSCQILRDGMGTPISFRERRLIRQSREDRVIAVVEAPAGSRVRNRKDQYGSDQLVVPLGSNLLTRFFGGRVAIPAKYVLADARRGAYGLSLVRVLELEPAG
jgi:hypothetical protein